MTSISPEWKVRVEQAFGGLVFEFYTCPKCGEETQYPMVHVLQYHCGTIDGTHPLAMTPIRGDKGLFDDCQHDYEKLQDNRDGAFYACTKCGGTKVERGEG